MRFGLTPTPAEQAGSRAWSGASGLVAQNPSSSSLLVRAELKAFEGCEENAHARKGKHWALRLLREERQVSFSGDPVPQYVSQ